MKIQLLDTETERVLISAHSHTSITIGETAYTASMVVSPGRIISDWGPASAKTLQASDLAVLTELDPELVLLGTGRQQFFPDQALLKPIIELGIGWEIMDTGAACRTFNILVAEGRTVVAGLII